MYFPRTQKKKTLKKKIRSKIPNSSNLYKPAVPFIKRIKGELRNVPHSLDGLFFLTLLPQDTNTGLRGALETHTIEFKCILSAF